MKSRVLQFLCSEQTIYVELPKWIFFFKAGGRQEDGDRNKPFKSPLREPHKDICNEQIRKWIYIVTFLCGHTLLSSAYDPGTSGGPQGPSKGSKREKLFV